MLLWISNGRKINYRVFNCVISPIAMPFVYNQMNIICMLSTNVHNMLSFQNNFWGLVKIIRKKFGKVSNADPIARFILTTVPFCNYWTRHRLFSSSWRLTIFCFCKIISFNCLFLQKYIVNEYSIHKFYENFFLDLNNLPPVTKCFWFQTTDFCKSCILSSSLSEEGWEIVVNFFAFSLEFCTICCCNFCFFPNRAKLSYVGVITKLPSSWVPILILCRFWCWVLFGSDAADIGSLVTMCGFIEVVFCRLESCMKVQDVGFR